jgi:DNA-binding response OmpR family regulator
MKTWKLLLVEDDNSIALLLKYGLDHEGFEVVRAENITTARMYMAQQDFHIVVLDIQLPDGNGFDYCRELRDAGIKLPILILTARTQTTDKVFGLGVGADDYLEKPFEQSELVARLNALVRRSYGNLADGVPTTIVIDDLEIDLGAQRVTRNGSILHLTATEFKLLAFFAQNPEQPFNRQMLLETVWGYDEFVGDARTVDVHIRNLRQKVEINPTRPNLIVTVRGAGYKLAH